MTEPTNPTGKERGAADSLRPALHAVEEKLAQELDEVCDVGDVHDESTGELVRLEAALEQATEAAKAAVTLRREIRREHDAAAGGMREFRDLAGRSWRVWEVKPDPTRQRRRPEFYMGDFIAGWLAFEALAGVELRRLVGYPADWRDLPDEALARLLANASPATRRRTGPPDAPRGADPPGEPEAPA